MIIAAETDEEAMAKWQRYQRRRRPWRRSPGWPTRARRTRSTPTTNVRQLAAPEGAVNINMGTLVGSYESVARMLDEMAEVPNTGGVLLTFDDFIEGVEDVRHADPAADEEPPVGLTLRARSALGRRFLQG